MKWLDDFRSRLLLIGFVAAIVIGVGKVRADFFFGEPEILGSGVNSGYGEHGPRISSDGLELYFTSNRPGGYAEYTIWVCTRATREAHWGEAVNLGPPVNTPCGEGTAYAGTGAANISADGLSLYFSSGRSDGFGSQDLYVTTRASKSAPWEAPTNLGPEVNSSAWENSPDISADSLCLFFADHPYGPYRTGGYGSSDIWVTQRESENHGWETPINLGPTINTPAEDAGPSLSSDGMLLFFHSYRPGGSGSLDLWMVKRTTTSDTWGTPKNLGPNINSSYYDDNPDISSDGSILYFESGRQGGSDLWQVSIDPIVDFNGDRIVDADDMVIMVDHWGTDYSLCDIGPMPWGDGVVDVHDLIVLAEHLFEQLPGRPIEP